MWNLPSTHLQFRKQDSPVKTETCFRLGLLRNSEDLPTLSGLLAQQPLIQNLNVRHILKELKDEHPEFPVYKMFRLLREKSCKFKLKADLERKENVPINSKLRTKTEKPEPMEYAVWTEKYKAQSSKDVLGNNVSIRELKKWLKNWVDISKEIVSSKTKRKRRSSSSSDFDRSDYDNRDTIAFPSNTVIISGPVASGKTMAVYAIANELDIDVLEVNASSKRTGKLVKYI